ncbi:hypothetical protein [Tabrizicola aquatica]|uniref:hypothetical protein n=1 Tax=Tabrizicola aquatica TaxID=909926 RepID=UPI0011AED20B|nr:hypothetical protein [Tabrizicola aquatica]
MKEPEDEKDQSALPAEEKKKSAEKPSAVKSSVQRVLWKIHARFPNFIPDPYGNRLENWRSRDANENIESAIPDGNNVQLGLISVSEIFGPNEIETLYASLERLGWHQERYPIQNQSHVDWLKNQRMYGTGGTIPLGWVHRSEDKKKNFNVRYTADFPKAFSSLLVSITQLTPSVTCISVGFVLTEEASFTYKNEINLPAQTTLVPHWRSGSYSVKSVSHVKADRIKQARETYRSLAISWVGKNFPGFFKVRCGPNLIPTAEYQVLEGFTPFDWDTSRDLPSHHWSHFLGHDRAFDSWVNSSTPSLRFSFDTSPNEEFPNHLTVALRWDSLNADDTRHYDTKTLSGKVYFAHERVDGIIAKNVLCCYLRELLRSLKEARQSLSISQTRRQSISEIEQISSFFRNSVGVPSIAREALELSEDDASFRWNATGFVQQDRPDRKRTLEIKDGLKSLLQRLSRKLLEEDQDTRDYLNQLSSAVGTRESMAAQKRMEILTWLAIIISLTSAIIAVLAISA